MPKPLFTQDTKKVPLLALRMATAQVEFGTADGSTVPVTIYARSPQPVDHWYFGRIVHDFAGMKRDERISLDYCHNDAEILGFGEKFSVEPERGLVVAGALTPFDKMDRASEIIHKSKLGVPYQGSIFFDPDELILEYVPDGMSTPVNGYQFEGPGVVAREWCLRNLAICPNGQDKNTAVEFSAQNSKEVEIKRMPTNATKQSAAKLNDEQDEEKKEDTELAEADEAPSVESEDAEEVAEEATPRMVKCPNCGHEFEVPAEEEGEAEPAELSEDDEKTGDTKLGKKSGKAFLAAFGKQGAVWFAEGKTFAQAQTLFNKQVIGERDRLAKENKSLKAKLSKSRGEREPVSFSNADNDRDSSGTVKQIPSLGKNLSRFAASIKLPTRKK